MRDCEDTCDVEGVLGLDVERPDDRSRWAIVWRNSPESDSFPTLNFGLLRARTTGGAPLPPLKVECKPLWRPENVARAFCPIRVSRTLDRMPLRKSCLSANEQLSFIRRLARGFWAAAGSACKCF